MAAAICNELLTGCPVHSILGRKQEGIDQGRTVRAISLEHQDHCKPFLRASVQRAWIQARTIPFQTASLRKAPCPAPLRHHSSPLNSRTVASASNGASSQTWKENNKNAVGGGEIELELARSTKDLKAPPESVPDVMTLEHRGTAVEKASEHLRKKVRKTPEEHESNGVEKSKTLSPLITVSSKCLSYFQF
jgi:hypothetical protein